MYTFLVAAVLAPIIGACFYGKKLWENRIAILLIFFGISFAMYFTIAIIQKSSLQTENVVAETGNVYKVSINDSIIFINDTLLFDINKKAWVKIASIKSPIIGPVEYDSTYNPMNLLTEITIDSVFVIFNIIENHKIIGYFISDDKKIHKTSTNITAYIGGPTIYEKVKTKYVTDNKWVFARSYPTINKFYRLKVNSNLLASL